MHERLQNKVNDRCLDEPRRYSVEVRRITWIGAICNIILSVIKLILGLLGSSQAVVADAIHSLSDLGTDAAVLYGQKFWSAPADEKHPYGHQRIETIVTAFMGVFLGMGAFGIGYNALTQIQRGRPSHPGWIAFAAAILSIVLKELLYRWTVKVGKQAKSSAVIANAWHHRTDAFSSIPVAIAVGVAIVSPKWSFLDSVGALVVSLFILHVAWKITRGSLAQLADEAVSEKDRDSIASTARETSGVQSVHALRTRRMGAGIFVDLHIMVDAGLTVHEGHEIASAVKYRLIEGINDVNDVIVHIEPYE